MKTLRIIQNIIIGVSLFLIIYLSLWSAFGETNNAVQGIFYQVSFVAVFLVMLIRPLADIFARQKWLRKLVFLRKSFGILSASIVVGFVIGDIISPESQYIASIFTVAYWSMADFKLLAHIGDITGFILLITSNTLSMIYFGKNWERIQKLAYVYFYSAGLYEMFALNDTFAFYAMVIVTITIVVAFIINHKKKML